MNLLFKYMVDWWLEAFETDDSVTLRTDDILQLAKPPDTNPLKVSLKNPLEYQS